ncbi:sensor domain-containing diguanylate cyclase [Neorhizobium alkalisoli]|uniref:Diguanylate cyclase (GGDEF)-like protein n=1 Tax=Neorhizobium alkalisoli TaxID=528178 RepID=A0A561R331_9HYPH|nr:sensor domain-containing diguanylate cyclase [Neorhizobium alkalisoli]TWF57024.1 diguanylate cyclase (GGDEF)-like protein [Neorhizobium alkalisoli]
MERLVNLEDHETLESRRLRGLELAMDHLPVAIGILTLEGKPVYLNQPFIDLYRFDWWQQSGITFSQMINKGLFAQWKIDPAGYFDQMRRTILQDRPFIMEVEFGDRVIAIHDRLLEGRFILSTQADVTARVLAERQVTYLAHHDPLTRLLNRAGFAQRFNQVIQANEKHGGRFGVLSLDLDHFKDINDIHGHAAGDIVLVEVARRMRTCLGDQGFIGRLGGDEFTIISTSDNQPPSVLAIATRLQESIPKPILFEGKALRVGVSIGIALHPDNGLDRATLLRNADEALYRAKREGRGRICIYDGRGRHHVAASDHEAGLQQAELFDPSAETGRDADTVTTSVRRGGFGA